MCEVAGRMSCRWARPISKRSTADAVCCWVAFRACLRRNVCVIGGGIVGTNAAKIAVGMGAKITIVDLNLNRLRELDDIFNGKLFTLASNSYNIERMRCGRPTS